MTVAVSVIVPTYNRAEELRLCLNALAAQTLGAECFEVLVIDDGSSDDTERVAEAMRQHPRLSLRYHCQANRGPAAARNKGIEIARGELIAFTDDDCRPAPDWLAGLLDALPNDPNCAGVGGRTVRLQDNTTSRYIDAVGMLSPGVRRGSILWLVTANALYRRSYLREVGGFEEQIDGAGGEDVDLSIRLRGRGYFFTSTERAVVLHNHRDTLRGLFDTYVRYGRGEAQQVRLGRKQGIYHRWLIIFLVCCLGLFGIRAVQLAARPGVRLRDRLAFPWLQLVSTAGTFIGYASAGPRARTKAPPICRPSSPR